MKGILALSAAETAAKEDSETQSEDDDVNVSEDFESEDELATTEICECKQLRQK